MRHPFDGIIVPPTPTRRSWLRTIFASVAGLFGLNAFAHAVAPPTTPVRVVPEPSAEPGVEPKPTTAALREEGAALTRAAGEAGGPLTRALNEAGGVTTKALGEEGAVTRARNEAGGPITRALREAGGVTTQALREEGAGPRPLPITTLAVGEEGGKKE